jgi:hypothetical protein
VPGLVPGIHYLEADKKVIPNLISWLLDTDAGQIKLHQVRQAGYEASITKYRLSKTLACIFGFNEKNVL